LLQYQDVFADALRRQVGGDPNALADLDPDLQAMPDDFLEYVADEAPGHALLEVGPLGSYLSSGEAVRSTQNPALLDALRQAGSVRRLIREAGADAQGLRGIAPQALKSLSLVEGPVMNAGIRGPLLDAALAGVHELQQELERLAAPSGDFLDTLAAADVESHVSERLDPLARDLVRRLLRMYRQGDVARPGPATKSAA